MTSVVCIDASVAAKWLLPEDDSELALQLLDDSLEHDSDLISPPHLPVEVTSAVYKRLRDEDITTKEADDLLEQFEAIPIALASPPGLARRAVELSRFFHWNYPYDAFYLALGEMMDCLVWTADVKFFEDARVRHVRLRLLADYA